MPTKTDELLVCRESFVALDQGGQRYIAGVTRILSSDPILRDNPSWRKFFEPAGISHPLVESAVAIPGEFRQ